MIGGGDLTLPPSLKACSIDFCFILLGNIEGPSLTFACETRYDFSSAATLADRNKEMS